MTPLMKCGNSGPRSRRATGRGWPTCSIPTSSSSGRRAGERIVGRDNVVAVNREYPEGWAIDVLHSDRYG